MKNFFLTTAIVLILTSCQSVKDGLTGKKKNNSDEFLIEKKNPLVQPPVFGKLPTPGSNVKDGKNLEVNKIEVLLKKKIPDNKKESFGSKKSSTEEFILEKIKNK